MGPWSSSVFRRTTTNHYKEEKRRCNINPALVCRDDTCENGKDLFSPFEKLKLKKVMSHRISCVSGEPRETPEDYIEFS